MIASSSDHFNFCAKYSQLSSVPSSPERRFKSISPCRRLFEELSTNQNSPIQTGFVVSNGSSSVGSNVHLATQNCNFLTNQNNSNNKCSNNNGNSNNNNFASYSDVVVVSKDERSSSPAQLTSNFPNLTSLINNNSIVDGLTDILYSSYQRRRSINSNPNSNSNPFMDDLGFLSKTGTTTDCYHNNNNNNSKEVKFGNYSMKSSKMVGFENNENVIDENNQLMSSPMKLKDIPMKSCSIRKSQMHWNHQRPTSFPLRRAMSENSHSNVGELSENGLIHHLPCFDSPHDAIKIISTDTLVGLLEGNFSEIYDRLFVIDCRYPYEYANGHIPGAVNVNTPEVIEEMLLDDPKERTLIVFHCEFSSERAPRMALHVRSLDRQRNKSNYPNLYYPEMYILDGGYKNYWQDHGDKCDPPHAYLPMRAPQFRDQLRLHQKMKHAFKSGCHLSQHSTIKKLPPKSKRTRSKSLNVANARKFFNDLITSGAVKEETALVEDEEQDLSFNSGNDLQSTTTTTQSHMFPSYTIPMANSFSSIFASELDPPSEMDLD